MERVLPQLKIVVKSDNRDWRTHFDQIKNLRNTIEQVWDLRINSVTFYILIN